LQKLLTAKNLFASFGAQKIIMSRSKFSITSSIVAGLTLSLALVLVASVPFGHALEIHHIFSTIDHDGHEHSDFDLCQWVQQHTSNSLAWSLPQFAQRSRVYSLLQAVNVHLSLPFSSSLLHSRGPPTFLFF
jgi:hypothetical protein